MDRQVGRSSASVFTAWASPHRQLDGGRSKHRHAPARKGVFRKARGSAFGKVIKNGLAQSKAEKTPLHHNAEPVYQAARTPPVGLATGCQHYRLPALKFP